jgi:hypothetical protein
MKPKSGWMFKLLKEKFDYIYENHARSIIWILLAVQAIAVAVASYN